MRIYAIPIVKNRWAYYCHSTVPAVSRLAKAVEWSSKKWDQLEKAEPTSWKKKLYVRGTNIMNQLDYQEWFFKSVPAKEDIEKPLNKVLIHHPSLLNDAALDNELKLLLKERIPYHKKYMWYSAYWVPLACTFAIVPLVPNIPLAYNLFRLYSHYKAYKGAEHLQSLSDYGNLRCENDERLNAIFDQLSLMDDDKLVFPSEIQHAFKESRKKPNLISLEQDLEGVLNAKEIKRLVETLQVPGLEMELNRARLQILKLIAKERFQQQL
ncbi:mitochondrial K+-H+ exchange-related-domain-containing protein [Gilbertella persicaria]|uniref:mitochondrial K+-H+ exchange-related-domain-containing protein n=1 Tax=Gilbertella persicaria TaxID=101096 RepID=UPI0022207386|nr:mitochondrial K+-H+ exchange-related-domain-containing protein [Gilbertella persicaria]KAI8098219.1 mitochondrial K+-H+ exchange-related-domain-containing protein [Gilbertella persicaria]